MNDNLNDLANQFRENPTPENAVKLIEAFFKREGHLPGINSFYRHALRCIWDDYQRLKSGERALLIAFWKDAAANIPSLMVGEVMEKTVSILVDDFLAGRAKHE